MMGEAKPARDELHKVDLNQRLARLSPEKRALLAKRLMQKHARKRPEIPRRENLESYPLSYAQERLWFLNQFDPQSTFYNVFAALRITGELDAKGLEWSLNQVLQRHEVLRANFITVDGYPAQKIAAKRTLQLPVVDLSGLSSNARQDEILRLASLEARQPFDLVNDPLLRARLFRMQENEHVIFLSVHHIVFDGWSTGVLVQELGSLYAAYLKDQPSPLTELPIQYADYAQWQKEWLQGAAFRAQFGYWREKFSSLPPSLEMPTDRPRPAVQTYNGGHFQFQIPAAVYRQLNALGSQQDATLFMTLLAAFQVFLYRYSGQPDISVGVPIANRRWVELEPLVGFFVNTLVLRNDLSDAMNFIQFLGRVREATLEAYANQDIPFEMLVEKLQPERDMSHTPLFQVMFDLQDSPLSKFKLGDLKFELMDVETGAAKFDLMLMLLEDGGDLRATFEYNSDLFDRSTIQRMAANFQVLLEGIASSPQAKLASLPLLSSQERQLLLQEWNNTAAPYPSGETFQDLFERQVERTPDAVAVVYRDKQLTYRQLNAQANQIAHYLIQLGVQEGDLIAICLERSLELLVGLLAILKAGGAYLPLDPAYPPDRLRFMLSDAQAPVLLSDTSLVDMLAPENIRIVYLDSMAGVLENQSVENPPSRSKPDAPAYVIYTSGSTGKPKGVLVPHRGALNLAAALNKIIYHQHPKRPLRLSLNAPLSFDASVQQLVMLLYGHALYIIPQELRLDGPGLLAYIRKCRLDGLDCVPTQLKLLLSAGLLDDDQWVPEIIMPGGEAIDEATWRTLAASVRTEVYNMYGPTECAVDSTIGHVRATPNRPTIGRPVSNARLYILDRHLQLQPIGVPGELCIGGTGVGLGYLHRPELTAQKFIADPFSEKPGERIYRTGDLVRYLPDGNVEFLGRIDHQVKVRGFRIELGEIDAVLKDHSAIDESVTVVREDQPGEKRLVAYLVGNGDKLPNTSELIRYLKTRLPDYMVPSHFVRLPAFPLTPNGKIDRRALPAPEPARPDLDAAYQPPHTPAERLLADLWRQVLGIEQVGVNDNFFELGGDSIRAAVLINKLQAALQFKINVQALFLSPTIAELAASLQDAGILSDSPAVPATGSLAPIKRLPRSGQLGLSFAQRRLWFLDQLEPGSPLYNISAAMRISGPLDVPALEASLNHVIARHEVLRTSFSTVDGAPALRIASHARLNLKVTDLSAQEPAQRETRAIDLAAQDARRPFDIGQYPLLRAALVRLDEFDHLFYLTIHHIIADGWSLGVLVEETAAYYQELIDGREPSLEELPVQYVDYAQWQQEWLTGDVLERQLDYWSKQLDGLPPLLELPADRPRPAVQTHRGELVEFELTPDLSQDLKVFSQAHETTLFSTLLAALQVLLLRITRQEDISIGIPVANRSHPATEKMLGLLLNTLVIRGDLSSDPNFLDVLNQASETLLQAYSHQDVPFEMLVDRLQPERSLSYSPLFQVMFAFQNTPQVELELPGVKINPVVVDSGTAKFDLALSMQEQGDVLRGSFEYNTDIFERSTIQRMLAHFEKLLRGVIAQPQEAVSRLPLLSRDERDEIIYEWNTTARPFPADRCAHQLFEQQVEATPDTVAVIHAGEVLTYRQLNEQANQLAHYLQAQGIGPETMVGLMLEKNPHAIIGLMGILKAGGAYVPLAPDSPAERLAFMLQDMDIRLVVTHSSQGESLRELGVRPVSLDRDWPLIARESVANPVNVAGPDNLAYVIYTSGSTGKPKGVLIEHRGLCNLASAYIRAFKFAPGSRIFQYFPLIFDGSVADIFPGLLSGAALVLPYPAEMLPGPEMNAFLRKEQVSSLAMTPSALAVLPSEDLPALELVVSAGENCPKDVAERWGSICRFVNAYGPTETTVAASWYELKDIANVFGGVPIGRPLENVQLYILDQNKQPTPVGIPGELFIGGVGVARGYLNRPQLTAEKFIPDPFSTDPAMRLYRSGDLARYLPDRNIEFLGRIDQQVKVRGYRIELGEIEAALEKHANVQQAAVTVAQDSKGIRRLAAYIVPDEQPAPEASELSDHLRMRLPDYMLPAVYIPMDDLPRNPSGKIDRRALPQPDFSQRNLQVDYQSPRTHQEEALVKIWQDVLGVEKIGVNDNFFELGGDSILSIQVIARASQAGLKLSPRLLFQNPTIAQLATVAQDARPVTAEQGWVEGAVELTPIQRWFFEQDFSEPSHWNQALVLSVHQDVEPAHLKTALSALLAHHDALRMRFQRTKDGWQQINSSQVEPVPLVFQDLSDLPEREQEQAFAQLAQELQASLDIEHGPLLRVALVRLGPGKPDECIFIIHHLVVDGVSWRILLADLQLALEQLERAEKVKLPLKTTSYQRWAARLAEYSQAQDVEQSRDYWRKLASAAYASLPVENETGSNTEETAVTVTVELSPAETRDLLQAVPSAYGADIQDALLAALVGALGKWTGRYNWLVNLEGHGREDLFDDVDISRTVGWFTNIYPLGIDLDGYDDPGAALKAVKESLRAVPQHGLSYGLLKYTDAADGSNDDGFGSMLQPQLVLNYLGNVDQVGQESALFSLSERDPGPSRSLSAHLPHVLSLNAVITGGQLRVDWSFSASCFQQLTVERVAAGFIQTLREIVFHCKAKEAPEYTPSDFPDVDLEPEEIDALMDEIGESIGG